MTSDSQHIFHFPFLNLFRGRRKLIAGLNFRSTHLFLLLCLFLFQTGIHAQSQYSWEAQPTKAAILVVVAHPDDEAGYFGGVMTYYGKILKLPIVFALMTNGHGNDPAGTNLLRNNEAQCATWNYGIKNRPLFGGFRDACLNQNIECNWREWGGREKAAEWVTYLIRKYKPDVVMANDLNGEYGHPNHMGAGHALMDAYYAASNPEKFKSQLESTGSNVNGREIVKVWQAKKLYLHGNKFSYRDFCIANSKSSCCPTNCRNGVCGSSRPDADIKYFPGTPKASTFCHDWRAITHPTLNGQTVKSYADGGAKCHVSQGVSSISNVNIYDLWDSKVGPDSPYSSSSNFMEHLDLNQYSPATYVNPNLLKQDDPSAGSIKNSNQSFSNLELLRGRIPVMNSEWKKIPNGGWELRLIYNHNN